MEWTMDPGAMYRNIHSAVLINKKVPKISLILTKSTMSF